MTKVASFEIEYTRFLGPDGKATKSLPSFAHDPNMLIGMYRAMVLTRAFDVKAISLQRTGRLGTYASSLGQEAVAVGVGAAMRPEDVLVPSFREHGTQFMRGVRLEELFMWWGGDIRGSISSVPRNDFPVTVPVGTHAPHAVGAALAIKLKGEACAAVCVFGDGATSKGDVYEAMNMAGVWKLPVIFVSANNQWAISVPREAQTAAETLAQKAISCGFEGLQVDGNDVIAVCDAIKRALEKAWKGGGPTFIEALTYRLSDHTTADDAGRYRDDENVGRHWKDDPIARLRTYLGNEGHWSKKNEEKLVAESSDTVQCAVDAYLGVKPQGAEAIFDHLFAELPADRAAQKAALKEGGDLG